MDALTDPACLPAAECRPRRPVNGRWGHVYAAVDLGTNNCRLLIARPLRDGFRVIDAFSRIVRLGEGLGQTGELSEPAMARAIEALRVCARKMHQRGVTRARQVATQACRSARNVDVFITRVKAEAGLDLDVISPGEEASLAVASCAPLLDRSCAHALVFDIGGGSTELMWLDLAGKGPPRLLAWISLPCGVVSLAEKYGDGTTPDSYRAIVADVMERLAPFEAEHGLRARLGEGSAHVIGTSGTVTTLAGVHLGLPHYNRERVDGLWLHREALLSVSRRLAGMSYSERAAHPCIGRERADLVLPGCAILDAIQTTWPCQRLRVADRGLREGMLLALMQRADQERGGRSGARHRPQPAAARGE